MPEPEPKPECVICPSCGRVIGEYTTCAGETWIRIGAVTLKAAHGVCLCGAEYHYSASARMLEELLARRAARTQTENPA